MDDTIEAIGGKKKSMQEIIDQMQAQMRLQSFASDSVSGGAPVAAAETGSDEGLRIVKGAKNGGVMSVSDMENPSIDGPNLPANADVKGLMERVVLHLQVETDNAANELSQKKLEQNAAAFAKKHAAQLKNIDAQVAKSRGAEGESALTKAFRWIGVAAAMATAVIASVASGGAATGLIIAAATALASAIGEESGGFKAIEKEISKSLQKDQGMTKKDADAAAGYITQAISMAVQMAGDISGACLTTAPEKAANTIVREGMEVAAKDTVSDMALKTARGMGEEVADKVAKAANEVSKDMKEAMKEAAKAGTKIEEMGVTEAVDGAVGKLSDKLLAKGLSAEVANEVMAGVNKADATQLLTTANQIAKVEKVMKFVDFGVSALQSGGGFYEQIKRDGQQREMRELEAVQQIVDAQQQQFLQRLSMENEEVQKIQQRVQNLQDSVVQMAQSRENAAQEIVENMVSMV